MQKEIKIHYVIVLIGIALILGGIVGFGMGINYSIDMAIKVGMRLMELNKISIDIDEDMIRNGIMQYKNNIGGCLFLNEFHPSGENLSLLWK